MLMVICGAGASNDSVNYAPDAATEQWRPPMGPGLFKDHPFLGDLMNRYEAVRKLAHKFRSYDDSVSLEAELERMQDSNRMQTREQLFALRYYLQRALTHIPQQWSNKTFGNTNYVGLVEAIDDLWCDGRGFPALYVTFNYDVMLDGALGQVDVMVGGDFQTYVANGKHKLIKPHGSVNWFHPVKVPIPTSHPYYMQILPGLANGSLEADDSFVFYPEQHTDAEDIPAIPALSIPVAKKSRFEMPPEQMDALIDAIPRVTHLLVIGWRGNEEKFTTMLNRLDRSRLKSLVVTRKLSSAKEVATALNVWNIEPHIHAGFSDLFKKNVLTDFLKS